MVSRRSSRFVSPSSSLTLGDLLERARAMLSLFGVAAIGFHVALSALWTFQEEAKAAKPLTTRFVKREPRLTKPLEMRKRPQPKRRRIQRTMVSVKARVDRQQRASGVFPLQTMASWAKPTTRVTRFLGSAATGVEPTASASQLTARMAPEHVVDMSLELVDVDALDTGRYHAMVIQDPSDKRNVKGFLRLKYAYSRSMWKSRIWHHVEDRTLCGLGVLVEALNRYTDIKATFEGRVAYASAEMLKTPWVFSYVLYPFEMGEGESVYVGNYLTSGGFLFIDALDYGSAEAPPGSKRFPSTLLSVRHMLQDALALQGFDFGRDWVLERLSNDHPLYHCYFDFDGAPASAGVDRQFELSGFIEGIEIHGRWVAILSQKGIATRWYDPVSGLVSREERMIQFGINTIIFALTQEGSITKRVMDTVAY